MKSKVIGLLVSVTSFGLATTFSDTAYAGVLVAVGLGALIGTLNAILGGQRHGK